MNAYLSEKITLPDVTVPAVVAGVDTVKDPALAVKTFDTAPAA